MNLMEELLALFGPKETPAVYENEPTLEETRPLFNPKVSPEEKATSTRVREPSAMERFLYFAAEKAKTPEPFLVKAILDLVTVEEADWPVGLAGSDLSDHTRYLFLEVSVRVEKKMGCYPWEADLRTLAAFRRYAAKGHTIDYHLLPGWRPG